VTGRGARTLAAVLLCAAPAAAAAFEWTGRVGLAYDRLDTWTPPAPRQTAPRLDVDLRLDVRGDVAGHGIVDYGAGAGWRRMTSEVQGQSSGLENALVYHADVTVLGYMRSPLTLRMFADRTDGTWERTSGETLTGERLWTSYGATMDVRASGVPALTLGATHAENEDRLQTVPFHDRSLDSLSATLSHSTSAFGLNAGYRGEWSEGSWVADRYDGREVNVTGTSNLAADRTLTVVDRYFSRAPSTQEAGSFGTEVNSFRAMYQDAGATPGRTTTLHYSDQRASTVVSMDPSALATAARSSDESRTNSLQLRHDSRLPHPEHFVRSVADVSMTDLRRGDASALRTIGGTVAGELWWRRFASTGMKLQPGVYGSRVYELAGGPLVGFVDTAELGTKVGYGGTAHARIGVPWRERQVAGVYDLSYSSNAYGRRGWVLAQGGNGTISGRAGIGGYSLALNVAAQRSWSPVIGPSASRSITGLLRYSWLRYSVQGQASISNGVLPGTSAFVGDGFFVPVGFDTRQTSVALAASASWPSGFGLRADARYTESIGPGQPSYSLYEASSAILYRYGAFDLSMEDRVTTPRIGGGAKANAFFVRVSRAFGSRY
jgi:hypothetical protein